ncbi:MAG: hypothetical protein ACI4VG_04510, partial [Lachnospiraceae bacterium]
MSLKHYLRGLGIGIFVTAVFFGLTKKAETMTDAEIKIRASQLGMVEETVLADLVSEEADVQEEGKTADADAEEEESLQTSSEDENEESLQTSSEDENEEDTEENGIITQ